MNTTEITTTPIFSRVTAKQLHRATFMMDKLIERTLHDTTGITLSQFLLLMQLGGGRQCQRDLATALGVTAAAISRQAAHLMKAQLIKRLPNEHDRRYEYLVLTAKGEQTSERAATAIEAEFVKVYESLSLADRQGIHTALTGLTKCYEARSRELNLHSPTVKTI